MALKGHKISVLGLQVLMIGLQGSKDILNSRQNRSKKTAVGENAATRVHVWKSLAPGHGLLLDRNHLEMKGIMLSPPPPPHPAKQPVSDEDRGP